MTDINGSPGAPAQNPSVGELVHQVTEQTSRLIRDELKLARAEMVMKGKKAGVGAGLFGGAGLFAAYGLGCLVAAAVLGLAGPLSGWLAALVVAGALFAGAGLAALVGRREVPASAPPMPSDAMDGLRTDVRTLKTASGA